jgi:Predicted nucleotidyltransferase
MKATGIICEYNPFHNGHLYHLNKVKEMFKDDVVVLVMSGHFMQRGETSIINKWDKTKLALEHGIDLVIELPFYFATGSADIFGFGAIKLLDSLNVSNLVFGSEGNNIDNIKKLANIQNSENYNKSVKKLMKEGFNYPTATSKALLEFDEESINSPNDILGLSYIKAIKELKSNIKPHTIKRTSDYHDLKTENDVVSASFIRNKLIKNENINRYVPAKTLKYLKELTFTENLFPFLKYKILTSINNLEIYHEVNENIAGRIKKFILKSTSYDELIKNIKSKKDTYNKISRILTYILCDFKKEDASKINEIEYIRVLGFSEKGRQYLNSIKENVELPIVTNFGDVKNKALDFEIKVTSVYASKLNEKDKKTLIEKEFKTPPIR